MGRAIAKMQKAWDEYLATFLAGKEQLSTPFAKWREAYKGKGQGVVDDSAIPEPYLGSLENHTKMVFLDLNPGETDEEFQYRTGIFATKIRNSSYSSWASTWPYFESPWVDGRKGVAKYHRSRLAFMRCWLRDDSLDQHSMATFELFPWHSARVTGEIHPDADLIREYIWDPIEELNDAEIFAFGAPWIPIFKELLLSPIMKLKKSRQYPTKVQSRVVNLYATPKGKRVVVICQQGYAGPPSTEECVILQKTLESRA